MTGHTRTQRREYMRELSGWLQKNHKVRLVDRTNGEPPSMSSLQAISDGIATLDKHGMTKPAEIIIEDQDSNAPAAYDFINDKVFFDPDLNADQLRNAVKDGMLSGRAKRDVGAAAMVHEITHRDHWREMAAAMGEDPDGTARQKPKSMAVAMNLMGNPVPMIGPTTDPFLAQHRFSNTATNDSGDPLSAKEARQVAFEVSNYATMNPLEFVAEVRTGVADGIQYSDRVMRLYEDYRGPTLPKVKGRKIKSVNSKKPVPGKAA